jgi:hypothetical protein
MTASRTTRRHSYVSPKTKAQYFVRRDDANPNFWVAFGPYGQVPGVDERTMRDAICRVRDLDRQGVL